MDPRAHNHRQGARRRCRLKVVTRHGLSFTLDVGAGGFCAQSLRVLAPGTVVEGIIHVAGKEVPFAGRVAWAKAGYPHMGLKGRMGIVLTRVSEAFEELSARPGAPEPSPSAA